MSRFRSFFGKYRFKSVVCAFVAGLSLGFQPLSPQAAPPDLDEILAAVLRNQRNLSGFHLVLRNKVFSTEEAFSPAGEREGRVPAELASNRFSQELAFVRDEYLGIVVRDSKGSPAAGYRAGGNRFLKEGKSLFVSAGNRFSRLDVLPAFVFTFSKFEDSLFDLFDFYGIDYRQVGFFVDGSAVFYKIGTGNAYALIDAVRFRFREFAVDLDGESPGNVLKIRFSDWHPQQFKLPRLTRYFLDDVLVKETRITALNLGSIGEQIKSVRKTLANMLSP